jgi:hypothetical protein
MNFFKPTLPYNRKLERFIGWVILILVCLAVPYTHGALQYCGLLLIGFLLVVLNHVIVSKKTSMVGTNTSGAGN